MIRLHRSAALCFTEVKRTRAATAKIAMAAAALCTMATISGGCSHGGSDASPAAQPAAANTAASGGALGYTVTSQQQAQIQAAQQADKARRQSMPGGQPGK